MIRDAILHLMNEQPMLADLFEEPLAGDVGLRCTNLRTMNGKRPIFVEASASAFFFPYLHVRFVEIPPASMADAGLIESMPIALAVGAPDHADALDDEPDLEIDEDFLRRIREV